MKEIKYIDLSHTLDNGIPVFPGDDKLLLEQTHYFNTDKYNEFSLKSGMHVGTHIDGVMHLTGSQERIAETDLGRFAGRAKVIDCRRLKKICISVEIEKAACAGLNILFCTGWDCHWGSDEYFQGYPEIDCELTDFLIQKQINIAGFDTPSPDKFPFTLHKKLLENNILIIENLTNLDLLLQSEEVILYAFALKIMADSSIIRAVARVR
jgi:kynurenine formamidase